MRKLIYMHMVSLDGFIEVDGPHKEPDWASGGEELNTHFNELEESIDAHLYGRRIYEQLATFWPVADANPSMPEYVARYARIWREKPKIVFSRTLRQVEWNARLVSEDAPGEIARLKGESGRDLLLFGATLPRASSPSAWSTRSGPMSTRCCWAGGNRCSRRWSRFGACDCSKPGRSIPGWFFFATPCSDFGLGILDYSVKPLSVA